MDAMLFSEISFLISLMYQVLFLLTEMLHFLCCFAMFIKCAFTVIPFFYFLNCQKHLECYIYHFVTAWHPTCCVFGRFVRLSYVLHLRATRKKKQDSDRKCEGGANVLQLCGFKGADLTAETTLSA